MIQKSTIKIQIKSNDDFYKVQSEANDEQVRLNQLQEALYHETKKQIADQNERIEKLEKYIADLKRIDERKLKENHAR